MRYMWCLLIFTACSSPKHEYKAVPMTDSIPTDASAEEMIAPYRDSLELTMNTILVENDVPLTRGKPESTLGNLIADLLLERALMEMADSIRPLVCLVNIGGLRVDLPKGPITVGKVFELMPFENELDVIKLSPEKVDEMLAYLNEVGGQPLSGLNVRVSSSTGTTKYTLDDGESVEEYLYVVTSDYLAEGGDNMNFFKDPLERIRTGIKIRDAIIDDFRVAGLSGKTLSAKLDGRISVIKF
ncbi:MAG: 2',3'-cyclic-nucleotide 2'-phosphodiesterase (5'-nucleotidase family) [Bacteroidia bacterium]|jgi:2',3'-cyclic-nucleotide 2'-phosphodiesterase (5'-nucleotidase family)